MRGMSTAQAPTIDVAEVERLLHALYIATPGTTLRLEDLKKAREIAALLDEVARAVRGSSRARTLTLVDAAAGKAYVGLLAAHLVLARAGQPARVVVIERDRAHLAASEVAAIRMGGDIPIEHRLGDVGDRMLWPEAPDLVVALHACGPASDAIIDQAIAVGSRRIFLVPCCTSAAVPADALAEAMAESLRIPRHGLVRRRFHEAIVAAERTLRLEAAGYQTEVMAFVPPTVTPHNLMWRARRVGEPGRTRAARVDLAHLRSLAP